MTTRVFTALVALAAVLAFALIPSGAASHLSAATVGLSAPSDPPPPTPYIQHVVVVVLENEGASTVWGHAPFERYLGAKFGNASSYYAACHPSAPNYLVMFAAVVNQCGSDAWQNYTNATLGSALDAADLTWGAYAEGLPAHACASPGTATAGLFATKHVPALYSQAVLQNRTYCHNHVFDADAFNDSMANGTLRNYSFYTPNLCDDGHNGCGGNTSFGQMAAQADEWLRHWLGPILNHTGAYSGSAERAEVNHTAFIVTWDEGLLSNSGFAVPSIKGGDNYLWCGQNGASGDAVCGSQVYTVIVSPYSLGRSFTANDSPYGLCRTVEWLDHLPPLGNPGHLDNRTGFPAMTALFNFTKNG
ncbi:MAG: alkaline phosphatase family protein [Thermoplasmata archaeon]|nr:alkaline phosphatase family protein [Thermoplasmata archaeon]